MRLCPFAVVRCTLLSPTYGQPYVRSLFCKCEDGTMAGMPDIAAVKAFEAEESSDSSEDHGWITKEELMEVESIQERHRRKRMMQFQDDVSCRAEAGSSGGSEDEKGDKKSKLETIEEREEEVENQTAGIPPQQEAGPTELFPLRARLCATMTLANFLEGEAMRHNVFPEAMFDNQSMPPIPAPPDRSTPALDSPSSKRGGEASSSGLRGEASSSGLVRTMAAVGRAEVGRAEDNGTKRRNVWVGSQPSKTANRLPAENVKKKLASAPAEPSSAASVEGQWTPPTEAEWAQWFASGDAELVEYG